jgi:hypothetical protein
MKTKKQSTVKVYIRSEEMGVLDLHFLKSQNIFYENILVDIPIDLVNEYREAYEKFMDMQSKIREYYK